jgi:hypothetical protein
MSDDGCGCVVAVVVGLIITSLVTYQVHDNYYGDAPEDCYKSAILIKDDPRVRQMMSDDHLTPHECSRIEEIVIERADNQKKNEDLTNERRLIEQFHNK